MMTRGIAIGLSCALAIGCASHHGPDHVDSQATLTIDPPTSQLMLGTSTPAMESFTATLTYPDGFTKDVTGETSFMIDGAFGGFNASQLTMITAGKATVFGTFTDKVATAEVIATINGTRVDPAVTAAIPGFDPSWFSTPEDPSHVPTVVYPPADVVVPRNLGDFDVHWTDASTNNVFEVSLKTEFANLKVYVLGGNGTAGAGPDPSWMAFLSTEWLASVGTETAVTFQVRGVNSANPTSVGSAPAQLVQLSNEAMNGGLYYWASQGSTSPEGIFRHDMANPGQPAQQYFTKAQTGGRCVACHVLSRDGTEMAITWDGGDHNGNLLDVASRALQTEANAWNFGAFTPDGAQFLSVHQGTLVVRNYANQAVLATMTSAGYVTHPDVSPDGTKLVYVRPAAHSSDWDFSGGQIFIRTYDPASLSFGPEQLLVDNTTAGTLYNNYYPSFSPDNQYVLFNRALPNGSAYNNANAKLFVIKADASAPAVELAIANTAAGLTDSWGRWAPFAQTFGPASEQMYWITVSSRRNFGVRLFGVNQPQIWMTPFFPARATAAMDPSAPAFRLPFQNIDSNNHIAQWTEQVVPTL